MRIRFGSDELERMDTDPAYAGRWPAEIVAAFQKTMAFLRIAASERDLRAFKGLKFEAMKKSPGKFSVRINQQHRLILSIESQPGPNNNVLVIEDITDYH